MKTSTFLTFIMIAPSFIIQDTYASSPLPDGDELQPECPCFNASELGGTVRRIIDNEIKLTPQACNDENTDGDGKFQYTLTWEELSTTNDEQKLQTINSDSIRTNDGGPPGLINQPEDGTQYGGYIVTLDENTRNGYCTNYPNAVSDPFNIVMMATCKNYIQAQCYIINNMVCPCYDMDDMTALKERFMNNEITMDVMTSCKKDHDTLPYGIYLEDAERDNALEGTFQGMDMGLWGVDVDNKHCYDGSDIVYPLTYEGEHCESLIESLCETILTSTPTFEVDGNVENPNKKIDGSKDGNVENPNKAIDGLQDGDVENSDKKFQGLQDNNSKSTGYKSNDQTWLKSSSWVYIVSAWFIL